MGRVIVYEEREKIAEGGSGGQICPCALKAATVESGE